MGEINFRLCFDTILSVALNLLSHFIVFARTGQTVNKIIRTDFEFIVESVRAKRQFRVGHKFRTQ